MILILIGSALLIVWGVAHLVPTKNVAKGFGDISEDNRRIITMEWIGEGLTLVFLGVVMILVTVLGDVGSTVHVIVSLCVIVMLIAMSVVSLLTGFRVKFLPYKLCPFIFCGSAILIALGSFI